MWGEPQWSSQQCAGVTVTLFLSVWVARRKSELSCFDCKPARLRGPALERSPKKAATQRRPLMQHHREAFAHFRSPSRSQLDIVTLSVHSLLPLSSQRGQQRHVFVPSAPSPPAPSPLPLMQHRAPHLYTQTNTHAGLGNISLPRSTPSPSARHLPPGPPTPLRASSSSASISRA